MTATQAKPKTAPPKVTATGAPLEIFAIVTGNGEGDGDGVSPTGPSTVVGIGGEVVGGGNVGAKIGGTGIFDGENAIIGEYAGIVGGE